MTSALEQQRCAFAVVGAAALAVHGVARSTRDIDLLTVDPRCLERRTWTSLGPGITIDIRAGDAQDPLAGIVRFSAGAAAPIDLVVGRPGWAAQVLHRARPATIDGVQTPVVTRADLILLKLYAGGPQDAWDIEQLLAGSDRDLVSRDVEVRLSALPREARALWARIRGRP